MSLCQKLVLTFVPRYSYGSMLRYVTMSKREKRTQSDCTSQETNSTVQKANQQSVKNGTTSHTTDSIKSTDSDTGKFIYEEKQGDLFSCDPHASLAHCISADIAMGKGIAVQFKTKFGGVHELKRQGKKVGEVAILRRDGRFIYYLVTKSRYFHKPTYDTLQASLLAMKEHCQQNNVTDVAMPKIGCGLDRLQWECVSQMLKEIFGDLKMTLAVYSL